MTSFADPGSSPDSGDQSRDVQVKLDADVSAYSQSIGQAQQETDALNGSVGKLTTSMSGLARFAGKQLIHFAAGDFAALGGAVADAASLERQLGTLRATSVVTGSSMGEMKAQLDSAFTSFPVARSQVIQLAETINSLGVTAPKAVGSMVGTFTKLGAATGESPVGLASGSLQLDRQLGNTDPGQVAGYANSLLTVSKNQGVAASGVLEFASNIAPMARAAGIGEAAILGISAAFSKAGADGSYAANAFNQISTDITQLSQTGSPALAKYSSFVGKTVSQFKAETGTEQVTSVFDQIAKGGSDANSFVQSLGLGQRAVKSVQAVAQSGGLSQAIEQAQGSTGNTKNLDNASSAAFSGLTNSLQRVGNEITSIGESIGEPILKVVTPLADAFGSLLSGVDAVIHALGPLPAIAAGLAGALAIPAGLALGHAGIVAGLAVGRQVLGSNSAPRMALREGRAAGAAMAGGMSREAAMMMGPIGRRVAAGQDPENPMGAATRRMSAPYAYGMTQGQRPPSTGGSVMGTVGRGARRAGAGVMGAGTWFMNDQTRAMRDSRTDGPERSGNVPRSERGPGLVSSVRNGSARRMFAAGRGMVQETTMAAGSMAASGVGAVVRAGEPGLMRRGIANAGGMAASAGGNLFRGASALGGAMFSPLGMIASMVAIPAIGGMISKIKSDSADRSDVTGSLTGASKYDQALDKSSTNLATFGKSVTDAANRLAGFAKTPVGQLAGVTGADVNAVSSGDYKIADPALAKVVATAKNVAGQPGGDKDAVKKSVLSYLDAQGIQAGSVTGDTFTKYKQDLLSTLGTPDANSVSDIMGTFAKQVNQTGGIAASSQFGSLAALAGQSNSTGLKSDNDTFKSIFGAGVAGVVSGTQESGTAGSKSKMANLLNMGAIAGGAKNDGQADRLDQFGSYLQQTFSIDPAEFKKQLVQSAHDAGTSTTDVTTDGNGNQSVTNSPFSSTAQAIPVLVKAFAATPQGKALMGSTGMTQDQLIAAATNPGALPPPAASETNQSLAAAGPLGLAASRSTTFQRASTGDQAGAAGPGFIAAQELVGKAADQAGGNFADASANLMKLSDTMGGMATPTGALIKSASDWARQLQSWSMPSMSREDQLTTLSQNAAGSASALTNPLASDETKASAVQDRSAFESEKESYRQNMIGKITQVRDFDTSQQRAGADQTLQVTNSNRDFNRQQSRAVQQQGISVGRSTQEFGISQGRSAEDQAKQVARGAADFQEQQQRAGADFDLQKIRGQEDFQQSSQRSEQDYQQQRQRGQEDFGLQQVRGQEDYNLQKLRGQQDYQQQSERSVADYQQSVNRQNEDHMRDLARQAVEASKDIYNPFIREQTKATTDSGSLIYNLKQQNADIEKQVAQVAALKKKGLSQASIDTLDLTNVANAQQVNTLTMSYAQDPNAIKQTNALVDTRVKDTTALTQDPASKAFRDSEADYARGQARASADFSKSQSRAAADYGKSVSRMADDYSKSQSRATSDFSKSQARATADFSKSQSRAAADYGKSLQRMGDDYSKTQARASADYHKSTGRMSDDYTQSQKRAREDQARTLANQAADFKLSQDNAVADHKTALDDMTKAFKLSQDRAAEDLKTSFIQYTGDFNSIFDQLASGAVGAIQKYAPGAGAAITSELNAVKAANPWITGTTTPSGAGSATSAEGRPADTTPAVGNQNSSTGAGGWLNSLTGHATGGVSLKHHIAQISENGPELILPLNNRGQDFMTGLITKSLAKSITTAISASPSTPSASMSSDNSVNFAGADIKIVAQDPNQMARELTARAKLARLSSPVRH